MKYNTTSENGQGVLIFVIFLALCVVCLWLAIGTVPGAQESLLYQLGL